LLFQGTADEELVAYDAATGERLWSMGTQTGVLAPPITYSIDGEQYIAVVAGWGAVAANINGASMNADGAKRNVSRILAFKIGGNTELPPLPDLPPAPAPPAEFGSDEQVDAGSRLYARYCSMCHGAGVFGGGAIPDLRHSAMIANSAAFESVVLEGAMLDNGMASFAEVLEEDDAEAVRAFIVNRANQ
jgi:mono/diheme cytochrome c family protein